MSPKLRKEHDVAVAESKRARAAAEERDGCARGSTHSYPSGARRYGTLELLRTLSEGRTERSSFPTSALRPDQPLLLRGSAPNPRRRPTLQAYLASRP